MMKLTKLEAAVLQRALVDPEVRLDVRTIDPNSVIVTDRTLTGSGFIAEIARTEKTRLAKEGNERWGRVGARLNQHVDSGYLLYLDDGYLTGIEGYTFGDDAWPENIEAFALYDINPDGKPGQMH